MLRQVSERIANCYHHASECRAKANDAFNGAAKQEYLDIEERWLMLARSYELSDRVTDYINEAERRLRLGREETVTPRVRCPECGKQMRLATIEPRSAVAQSANIFTYDCRCGFTCDRPGP